MSWLYALGGLWPVAIIVFVGLVCKAPVIDESIYDDHENDLALSRTLYDIENLPEWNR